MTKQLEDELAAWMRRQADQSWNGTDVAPGAFRKSRRIRRQRRIATVVVAAAALAGIVAAGTQVVNLATPGDQVVNTPTTTAVPKPGRTQAPKPLPADSKPISIDFGKLRHGTTRVAWWDAKSGVLRWGKESLPLGQNGRPEEFARLSFEGATRYAVFQTTSEVGARLDLVGGQGAGKQLTDQAETFAVSADAKQIAYTTGEDHGVSVASSSGQVLHSKRFGFIPKVTGFVGDSLILSSRYDDKELVQTHVWNLRSGQVRTVKDAQSAVATVPAKGLVAVQTGNPAEELCNAVIDVNDGDRQLWRGGCGQEVVSLSPDGRYAVLSPPTEGDVTDVTYTFVDLRSGRDVLKLRAASWDGVAWEAGSVHVVLSAYTQDDNALVRCDLFGTCELVGDPLPWVNSNLYGLPVN